MKVKIVVEASAMIAAGGLLGFLVGLAIPGWWGWPLLFGMVYGYAAYEVYQVAAILYLMDQHDKESCSYWVEKVPPKLTLNDAASSFVAVLAIIAIGAMLLVAYVIRCLPTPKVPRT